MMDFSRDLIDKTETIIKHWMAAVRQDIHIETANKLPYKSLQNSMPRVLKAMATVLSESKEDDDLQALVQNSLEHGVTRAEQGYEAEEIAREYRILREVIFSTLEVNLLQGTPTEIIRAFRLIDTVIDEAIARGFKSYTDQRLGELKQLESQLTLNNQELTRLVRANQDKISHLAHELKSPLTAIIGYADLFLRQQQKTEVKDNVPNLEHIERVLRGGRKLLHLINDALEISRYEAGQMQLQPTTLDVRFLIKDVVEMLEPLAQTKELQLELDCDRAPEQVVTDSLRLQQVMTNLLSNAIRYTNAGSIQIICQVLENNCWAIAVADTGKGIALENQQQIFEPYFRVATTGNYLPDSTGLGLAIVSRLVKLLQGKIELVSQVGVGSTFTVILPLVVSRD